MLIQEGYPGSMSATFYPFVYDLDTCGLCFAPKIVLKIEVDFSQTVSNLSY